MGAGLDYGDNRAGRYYAEKAKLTTAAINPRVGYRVTPWLSLGGGVNIVYGDMSARTAIDTPLDEGDGRLKYDASDVGYGFYLLEGKPVFLWNLVDLKRIKWEGPEVLTPGKHTLEFDFTYDGLGLVTLAFNNMSGLGRSGVGTLKVDGKAVQTIKMKRTLPMILPWDESFYFG